MSFMVAEQFLSYCSPVFTGIKPSALMMVKTCMLPQITTEKNLAELEEKGFEIKTMGSCSFRTRLLIFERKALSECVYTSERFCILQNFGYQKGNLDELLATLQKRFTTTCDFPHEIGIFLGYPTEDVKGFLEHKGKDYRVCGYWKVYGNETMAVQKFASYKRCRKENLCKLYDGVPFRDIVKGEKTK